MIGEMSSFLVNNDFEKDLNWRKVEFEFFQDLFQLNTVVQEHQIWEMSPPGDSHIDF